MIKDLNPKTTALMIMLGLSVIACKKKEEPAIEAPKETPAPCFNSNYNGTYAGTGYVDYSGAVSTYTAGTLTINKTGCNTADVSLSSGMGPVKPEQFSQLTLNSSGGYDGKLNNGNNVTLILGSVLQLTAVGSFTFTGPKQ